MTLEVPPSGTRGVNVRPLLPLLRAMNAVGVWLYRRRGGGSGRMGLLLTTIGARTGKERTVGLSKFSDEQGRLLVVASLAGAARHPGWLYNLARNPDQVWVEMGRERIKVRPEILRGEERDAAWRQIISVAAGYAAYEDKTDREMPIVRLVLESGA